MKKRVIGQQQLPPGGDESATGWLDLEGLIEVEISSEDPAYPIENALRPGAGAGWRAAGPGEQTIRLLFTRPQALRRIRLHFIETELERTQECVLSSSAEGSGGRREIVRQQWNFSPSGSTAQTEDYSIDLAAVRVLELRILPAMSGGGAVASLAEMQLA